MRGLFEVTAVYLVGFFSPISAFVLAIGFFVIADMVLGSINAKRNNEYSSKQLFRTVPKFIAYSICVICSRIVELLYFPEFPATKLISGLIMYVELVSIDEKVKAITGKSFLKTLTDKLNFKRK